MKTAYLYGLCNICEQIIAYNMSAYLIHMIDVHWDLVERIHQTTGNDVTRQDLVVELTRELGASTPERN